MILMFWAQYRVKATYEKYAEIQSSLGMTGAQVAKTILQRMGFMMSPLSKSKDN
jgi:Zn-dependent membrane protease YugP